MRIVLVAGELSGDGLGAGLIRALRMRYPAASFEGIGGPAMQAAGLHSLVPLERLSVMGLVEVLRHLPELRAIQQRLLRRYRDQPPTVFIGIDAPDFNLRLARPLRARGIPTVHYVGPSVWAWRRGRLRGISQAVDLMLVLLPFELPIYQAHGIPAVWVGHPLADELSPPADRQALARQLGLDPGTRWVALLPGSRMMEVRRLGPLFLHAAHALRQHEPGVGVVLAAATPALADALRRQHRALLPDLPLTVITARTREVLGAAEVALIASGTATLEALLLGCPQVVAYQLAPFSAWLARRLVRIPHFSLPNLLAGEPLVAEYFQEQATPVVLSTALQQLLAEPDARARLRDRFAEIRNGLAGGASQRAATAVAELLETRRT